MEIFFILSILPRLLYSFHLSLSLSLYVYRAVYAVCVMSTHDVSFIYFPLIYYSALYILMMLILLQFSIECGC